MCWYCEGDLCYACWDRYGHCGHAGANELNRRAQDPEARSRMSLTDEIEAMKSTYPESYAETQRRLHPEAYWRIRRNMDA